MKDLVKRLAAWMAASSQDASLVCGSEGCNGDARYSPPSRGHVKTCLWVGDF